MSERGQKIFGRSNSPQKIRNAAAILNKYKGRMLPPQFDIIVDNPYETSEDYIETIDFLLTLPKPFFIQLFSLMFYPGTEIYRKAKADGLITDELKQIVLRDLTGFNRNYINFCITLFDHPKVPFWIIRLLSRKWVVFLLHRKPVNELYSWLIKHLKAGRHKKKILEEGV